MHSGSRTDVHIAYAISIYTHGDKVDIHTYTPCPHIHKNTLKHKEIK